MALNHGLLAGVHAKKIMTLGGKRKNRRGTADHDVVPVDESVPG